MRWATRFDVSPRSHGAHSAYHRIGARQIRLSDGWAWWVTVTDGREEWMIAWRRDRGDLSIRVLERV